MQLCCLPVSIDIKYTSGSEWLKGLNSEALPGTIKRSALYRLSTYTYTCNVTCIPVRPDFLKYNSHCMSVSSLAMRSHVVIGPDLDKNAAFSMEVDSVRLAVPKMSRWPRKACVARMGVEPTTFALSARRSNQLS